MEEPLEDILQKNSTKLEEHSSENNLDQASSKEHDIPFKKPSFIGKARCLKKPINSQKSTQIFEEKPTVPKIEPEKPPEKNVEVSEKEQPPLPYKEPSWSGLPPSQANKPYTFEVLKNGCIIETINLMEKPFWVFGRLPICDISMQHPTISRYHAILQYRSEATETEESGFYIYDLSSTHGTFLNNKSHKLKSRVYTRIHVGHMLRLGCSQRSFILTGPDQDQEDESEFTVTELKQQRADRIKQAKEEFEKRKLEDERRKKKEEERGVDWGMGEDASEDEEENLAENPFAQSNNEELYLDDPKKALRGFFEREGFELEYDCSEQGMGQFLCKVELPLDDDLGRPIVVEVVHKGKKKEAVVQCALEACRMLDRYGVLRQATHESRKRKSKNWEENDYYDSDDDTFLDRTGSIEKKREKRMTAKQPRKAETYESLVEKEKNMMTTMSNLEKQIQSARDKADKKSDQNDEDSLDSFMKNLNSPQLDKQKLSKMKLDLVQLKKEYANVLRLINIAKPASLPFLKPQTSPEPTNPKTVFPMVGKRPKTKLHINKKSVNENVATPSFTEGEEIEEEESDSERNESEQDGKRSKVNEIENDKSNCREDDAKKEKLEHCIKTSERLENVIEMEDRLLNKEKAEDGETTDNYNKRIPTFEKVAKNESRTDRDDKETFSNTDSLIETLKRSRKPSIKKRKKEDEKMKGYEGESLGDDYSMWVPPDNQSGDGRTSLNEKLGY